MENFEKELDSKRQEFSKWFFVSILSVFLFYILMFFFSGMVGYQLILPIPLLVGFLLILAIGSYILLKSKFPFDSVFTAVLIVFFILITYLNMLLCHISEAVFISYLPLMSIFLMLTSFKKSLYFSLILIIFCFFLPEISAIFNLSKYQDLYFKDMFWVKIQEYSVIVFSVYFTLLILYYHFKFFGIRKQDEFFKSLERSTMAVVENVHIVPSVDNDLKSKEKNYDDKAFLLYQKILKNFEEEKPYQCPKFNIRKLAELLDTNITYISVALNKVGDKKFNVLVNEYRIEQVKKDILQNAHHKFTIQCIYNNAGFSSQSTFNRIFKEQTGFTPSEYIENVSEDNK